MTEMKKTTETFLADRAVMYRGTQTDKLISMAKVAAAGGVNTVDTRMILAECAARLSAHDAALKSATKTIAIMMGDLQSAAPEAVSIEIAKDEIKNINAILSKARGA